MLEWLWIRLSLVRTHLLHWKMILFHHQSQLSLLRQWKLLLKILFKALFTGKSWTAMLIVLFLNHQLRVQFLSKLLKTWKQRQQLAWLKVFRSSNLSSSLLLRTSNFVNKILQTKKLWKKLRSTWLNSQTSNLSKNTSMMTFSGTEFKSLTNKANLFITLTSRIGKKLANKLVSLLIELSLENNSKPRNSCIDQNF